jgi:hypothetical protein
LLKKILYFKNIFRGFFEIDDINSFQKTPVLLFCHDFTRNFDFKGKKYSSLIDSINDLLNTKGIVTATLARPYSEFSVEECYGKIIKVNGCFARARFKDYVKNLIFNKNEFSYQEKLWNRILCKLKPKIIIGIEPFKEFAIAAQKLGIIVFDLQHGIISSTPPPHFYKLSLREPLQKGWPNFIICRDIESLVFLNEQRTKYTIPLLIGHPWLSRFFIRDKQDSLVKIVEDQNRLKFTKPIILFSLQHLRDESGAPNGYSKIPISLINIIKSQFGSDFQWCFRLHPILLGEPNYSLVLNDLKNIFKNYDNVDWDFCTKIPLPFILKYTSLHFTRDSSTAIEAAEFNIKTGLLDIFSSEKILYNNFRNYINKNLVFILPLNDENILKSFIETNIKKNNIDNVFSMEKQNNNFDIFGEEIYKYINDQISKDLFYNNLFNIFNKKNASS